VLDNYTHTRTTFDANSVNGTFYTDLSAARDILNTEKQHLKTILRKRHKADPEINIRDEEIRAMFQM
jgi:hypothetical protein